MNRKARQRAAAELYGLGLSLRDIGERLGVSHMTIQKDLRELGVKPKQGNRQRTVPVERAPYPQPVQPLVAESTPAEPLPEQAADVEQAPELAGLTPREALQAAQLLSNYKTLPDTESVTQHARVLYATFLPSAREGNLQAAQLCEKLLARIAGIMDKERSCKDHVSIEYVEQECAWLNGLWSTQLQVALRELEDMGVEDAGRILDDAITRVKAQAVAGRN